MGLVLAPGTVIALGLAGLPLTGGALAKLAVKDPLGYGIAGTLAMLSAAGTALLMTHFLSRLAATADHAPKKPAPVGLFAPWLATALLCLIVPWASVTLTPALDRFPKCSLRRHSGRPSGPWRAA